MCAAAAARIQFVDPSTPNPLLPSGQAAWHDPAALLGCPLPCVACAAEPAVPDAGFFTADATTIQMDDVELEGKMGSAPVSPRNRLSCALFVLHRPGRAPNAQVTELAWSPALASLSNKERDSTECGCAGSHSGLPSRLPYPSARTLVSCLVMHRK